MAGKKSLKWRIENEHRYASGSGSLRFTGTQAELRPQLAELAREIVSALAETEPVQCKELLGVFVSELFSSVADQEQREARRQKQMEAITAAKARGAKFGRPCRPLPENFQEIHRSWRDGEMTLKEAAAACDMPVGTFYNKVAAFERENTG